MGTKRMKTAVTAKTATEIVGLELGKARKIARQAGLRLRVDKLDGQPQIGTCDHCTDRILVDVEDGKVIKASVG